MPTTRSQIAALPTCAGRKRKATETSQPAKKAKKIKTGQSADETYLQQVIQECTRQLRTYPKRVQRREIVENSLKYFRRFELAKQGDAIFFDDAAEARNLLASNKAIDRPVFVRDGANWSLIDRESSRRPIEQIFDFLNDPEERVEFPDQSKPSGSKYETMRVGDLKKRFLEPRDSVPRYPRNFRDIVTPLPDCGIPQFMQSAQCMLLHDIMRRQLDRDRPCGCLKGAETTRRSSCAHRRSTDDHLALADIWDFFKGTLMLSEPGSITYPHWDKFSTSTWISCIEGEIGFGWLVDPSKEENTAWLDDVAEPKGRYVFRVLRPAMRSICRLAPSISSFGVRVAARRWDLLARCFAERTR